MSNVFTNWLQSRKFSAALKRDNIQLAQELLENKQRPGVKLSLTEKIFRDKLQLEQSSREYEMEVLVLRKKTSQNLQEVQELTNKNQQLEKYIKDVYNQLNSKEKEVVSVQQQLEAHGQEIETLRNQQKYKEQETISIQQQLNILGRERPILLNQLNQTSDVLVNNLLLPPLQEFNKSVKDKFKFNEINDKLLQFTGIDQEIFYELEENLVKYLESEFERYAPQESLKNHLKETHHKDISTSLQRGQDPEYIASGAKIRT